MDQSSFAAPQGLSQRTTSFIASQRQGIHQMLLRHLIALMIHVRHLSMTACVAARAPSARGAQAIRKTCSRLSPGTFLLAKWTRRTALRGPCAGGQRQCAGSSRIHSLFTISNTRTPSHKEQNVRVSFRPAGLSTNRTACLFDVPDSRPLWWSQTGSNRRPHACKARALPTELWPLEEVAAA